MEVQAYPTLILFENSKRIATYARQAERTSKKLAEWVVSQTHPELDALWKTDCEALEEELNEHKIAAVFFGEKLEGELWDAYDVLQDPDGSIVFLSNTDAECAKKWGAT